MMRTRTGIYIHIPFCIKKCKYCDFVSANRYDQADDYFEKLEMEIQNNASPKLQISTLYFGGGTPSSVDTEAIERLIHRCKESFSLAELEEVTIEANPGTLDESKVKKYLQIGINRLSVGVQSFDDEVLNRLGRIHTGVEAYDNIELARRHGFQNISLDLMYGLPKDSLKRLEKDLDKAIHLGVKHISVYGLILEPGTVFYEEAAAGSLLLPEEEELLEMRDKINQRLENAGLYRYEIANYAAPGFESKHNLLYWQNEDYLGFGLNSTGKGSGQRYKNTDSMDKYLTIGDTLREIEPISKEMAVEEGVFLGLRLMKGIDIHAFNQRYEIDIEKKYQQGIAELTSYDALVKRNGRLLLTSKGLDLANYCMSRFLT